MTLDQAIERIQFAYPQIYFACHTRHSRKRSTSEHVSARDGQMLVHLDREAPTTVSALASHLGLARSTVSEAMTRLERHGYVAKRAPSGRDRRHVGLVLTTAGVAAVRASSVLEVGRLRTVLRRLPRRDLAQVIDGLTRLAAVCRERR